MTSGAFTGDTSTMRHSGRGRAARLLLSAMVLAGAHIPTSTSVLAASRRCQHADMTMCARGSMRSPSGDGPCSTRSTRFPRTTSRSAWYRRGGPRSTLGSGSADRRSWTSRRWLGRRAGMTPASRCALRTAATGRKAGSSGNGSTSSGTRTRSSQRPTGAFGTPAGHDDRLSQRRQLATAMGLRRSGDDGPGSLDEAVRPALRVADEQSQGQEGRDVLLV